MPWNRAVDSCGVFRQTAPSKGNRRSNSIGLHAHYPPDCDQRHLGNVSMGATTRQEPAHVGTVDGGGDPLRAAGRETSWRLQGLVVRGAGLVGFRHRGQIPVECGSLRFFPAHIGRGIRGAFWRNSKPWLFSEGCSELWLTTDVDIAITRYSLQEDTAGLTGRLKTDFDI